MLNVQELERQWIRYKVKHYFPLIGAIFVGIVVLVLILLWWLTPKEETPPQKPVLTQPAPKIEPKPVVASKPTPEPTAPTQEVVSQQNMQSAPSKKKSISLSPSMDFINHITPTQAQPSPVKESLPTVESVEQPVVVEHQNIPQPQQPIADTVSTPQKAEALERSAIVIDTHEDEQDIQDVLERFKNNKKPALSLFAAKRYYAIGKYREAYNYALITNELNSKIEESWLIAAKSLVRLKKREDAIRLLEQFIDTTQSVRAKILLDQIRNGTMK